VVNSESEVVIRKYLVIIQPVLKTEIEINFKTILDILLISSPVLLILKYAFCLWMLLCCSKNTRIYALIIEINLFSGFFYTLPSITSSGTKISVKLISDMESFCQ